MPDLSQAAQREDTELGSRAEKTGAQNLKKHVFSLLNSTFGAIHKNVLAKEEGATSLADTAHIGGVQCSQGFLMTSHGLTLRKNIRAK